MKIKQISSLIVMLFACLANISGDKLEPLDKRRCRTLNTFERPVIDGTSLKKNCYVDVRLSIVHGAPSNAEDPILKEFRKIIANGTFDRLAGLSLESLIQGLGANLETENLVENRIRLWFIREKISDSDSIDAGTLEGILNFKTFHATWKDLLGVIKSAKEYANRQPEGSDAVKLCDSFRTVSSKKSSSNYAKVLADMLENSPATWNEVSEPLNPFSDEASSSFDHSSSKYSTISDGKDPFSAPYVSQFPGKNLSTRKNVPHNSPVVQKAPVIPVQQHRTPIDVPPSSHAEATADRFASPNPPRQDSYGQRNSSPKLPGSLSARDIVNIGLVASSARGQRASVVAQRALVTEMIRKFPLNVYDPSLTGKIYNWLMSQSFQELQYGDDEYRNIPQSLKDFLDSINYMAIETPGFGNCAFDSVLLSLFCLDRLYKPGYNKILGAYLEQQIHDFRKFVALNTGDISLKNDIKTPNKPVDQNVFSVIAPVLLRKILLIIPHGISDVLIECYSSDPGNPVVERPDYKHGQTNQAFFDSHKDGALIIAFNGFGHYVAVRPK